MDPMTALALVTAGTGVLNYLSGQEQSDAISEASAKEAQAQANALALQERMYDEGIERQAPWLAAGQNALAGMQDYQFSPYAPVQFGEVDVTQDPGYQFRMEQGQQALERAQAGQPGGALSGRALKEAMRYNQGLASQEYGQAYGRSVDEYNRGVGEQNRAYGMQSDAFNRLASLAGVGQTAIQGQQNLSSQYGQNVGNLMLQQGQGAGQAALAQGGVQAGMYSNLANTAMQGANLYQQQNALNRLYPQQQTGQYSLYDQAMYANYPTP
jgi:hypothetical protein